VQFRLPPASGCPVSSAILYLAIIAIWAGFLVPAWLRRPHGAQAGSEAGDVMDGQHDDQADDAAGTDSYEEPGRQAGGHIGVTRHIQEYRDDVPDYAADSSRPPALLSQSREQMLRARRRMLTILTAMTFFTVAFALLGALQWWICVPPAGMLVLYVLLLREIAMADAELARKREAWEVSEARHQARAEQAAQAMARAGAAERTAQIIDISSRIGDQLYDQYADAAVRAVGD
jgi:hypothetical protein